jgi:hypothetical protein
MNTVLNYAHALALFEEQSVLFGKQDGVPIEWAEDYFGEELVSCVKKSCRESKPSDFGSYFNGFGVGDYTAWYITKNGFMRLVTYSNVRELQRKYSGRDAQKLKDQEGE